MMMNEINDMPQKQSTYDIALALIDAANSEDPNQVTADGKDWPKEFILVYSLPWKLRTLPAMW